MGKDIGSAYELGIMTVLFDPNHKYGERKEADITITQPTTLFDKTQSNSLL